MTFLLRSMKDLNQSKDRRKIPNKYKMSKKMQTKDLDQLLSWNISLNRMCRIRLFLENLSNKDTSPQIKFKIISNNSNSCLTLLFWVNFAMRRIRNLLSRAKQVCQVQINQERDNLRTNMPNSNITTKEKLRLWVLFRDKSTCNQRITTK